MPGKKKKLNAKKKAENQRHVEHRRQREEEEAARPKSFNEAGPSSAPGFAKRKEDCCSAKHHHSDHHHHDDHHSTDSFDSEGIFDLEEQIDLMDLSNLSDPNQDGISFYNFDQYNNTIHTGIAIVQEPVQDEKHSGSENEASDPPKFKGESGYIRTVSLASRKVNKLSRPHHIDLYDLYFQLSTVLEYLSNYTVQVLVSKNKASRKPFLKKLGANNINEDLQKVLDGLPEFKESHRKPIDIEEFQAIPEQKKSDLRKYINSLAPLPQPEPEPNNHAYFERGDEGEGVLTNDEFPNPFARVGIEIVENEEPVFNNQPNTTDLSLPRLSMLAALIGQKRNYKRVRPALTNRLIVDNLPKRYLSKFLNLMTTGFCFLGKLIIESLHSDEKINRGNIFDFQDGDVGFWWAGVIILDWNEYLLRTVNGKPKHKPISCINYIKTVGEGSVAFKAMLNLGPDGLYFTDEDQKNFQETIERIKHKRLTAPKPEGADDDHVIANVLEL
ncbi:unnamed protein product [Bemisia tabaci]|uniref:Uncharacterized protein n=1 Tax=Bemisia tabaci TaxID=7038 RepID=A0A9P0F8M6_BEMTA|nr:PREDICTED: uncharacterized protein LOC109034757 [Bemisia tabaci]XP_018903615.1 PREDICTED: uncharacterized protein LOC109034757 [Bemisia tabaci]CAH0392538.1 unnamed protein product [Bemisia tabaci]